VKKFSKIKRLQMRIWQRMNSVRAKKFISSEKTTGVSLPVKRLVVKNGTYLFL
jgi:hypothetical protein